MFILFLLALFFIETPATLTYFQAHQALEHHIQVTEPTYEAYAASIARKIPADKPVVFMVPLNGIPDSINHPSYKNALISKEILKKIPNKKYLLYSEGYTGTVCTSGADLIASIMNLTEGYNQEDDITLLLERQAKTTVENITLSKQLLLDTFLDKDIYIVFVGMSDVYKYSFLKGDMGHAARAYTLANQSWTQNPSFHLVGIVPSTDIDKTLDGYAPAYNFTTMVLTSTGAMYLPLFNRSGTRTDLEECSNGL